MILGIISANLSCTINVFQGQVMTGRNRHSPKHEMGGLRSRMGRFIMEYCQVWIFVLAALALHAGIVLIFI